jgi:hypothetical protein
MVMCIVDILRSLHSYWVALSVLNIFPRDREMTILELISAMFVRVKLTDFVFKE